MTQPQPWLDTFKVNTGTANNASATDAQIIGLSNGNILVAWTEFGTKGVATSAGQDIVGKIYDAEGNLVKGAFRMNTFRNADDENDFDIAATNDGGFIIVYVDNDTATPANEDIRWERYDDAGNLTNFAQIAGNSANSDLHSNPQVVVNVTDNTSYVTFTDNVGGGVGDDKIRGVTMSATGTITASEFDAGSNQVNDFNRSADSAILVDGELVTVFEENDSGFAGIEFKIVNSAGNRLSNVNVHVGANGQEASDPQVASLAKGGFVVVWVQNDDIMYSVFNSDGSALTGTKKAAHGGASQNKPDVVALPDGSFVITWDNNTANRLEAKSFDADGTVQGGKVVIDGPNNQPEVGVTKDGRVLFTWSKGGDVFTSIWDTRGDSIDVKPVYDNPMNFFDTSDGDIITARKSGGTIQGEAHSEKIIGYQGKDIINANSGDDTIRAGGNNDVIDGGSGADYIDAGSGNDIIEGGFFKDTIHAGWGNDTILIKVNHFIDDVYGGKGFDTLDASTVYAVHALQVDLGAQSWSGSGGLGTGIIKSIEKVIGTLGDDTLKAGNLAGAKMYGGDGADNIRSGGNTQHLFGDGGDDTIYGGGGNDKLQGGSDNDRVSGGGGADEVRGDGGNDTLFGGSGNDKMFGGAGDDRLTGGSHQDLMVGGSGADTFVFNGSSGHDTIKDFDGNDAIEIADGANRMSDLTFTDTAAGLLVEFGSTDIFLLGLDRSDVNWSDFDFI